MPRVNSAGGSKTRATEAYIEGARRFWVNRRQPLPYTDYGSIARLNVAAQSYGFAVKNCATKVTKGDYDPSDDDIGHSSI